MGCSRSSKMMEQPLFNGRIIVYSSLPNSAVGDNVSRIRCNPVLVKEFKTYLKMLQ